MKQPQNLLPDDEMSLADLWQMLVAGWGLILGSLLAALVVAGIYLSMTPTKFEATLVIKVGQVGVAGLMQQKAGPVGVAGLVQEIEPFDNVVDRMQGLGFQNAVVKALGWEGDEREGLFLSSYQVMILGPASKHLKIRLYGLSPDDARRAAEACLAVLADIHRELAEEIVATRDREFASVVADIGDAEAFLHRIEPLGKEILRNDRTQGALWLQAVIEEKSRLRALRMREGLMKESMRPELTKPTLAVGPVVVSNDPVYPKVLRVWIFAIAGGIFLGILLVSLRSIIRMNTKSRVPFTQR